MNKITPLGYIMIIIQQIPSSYRTPNYIVTQQSRQLHRDPTVMSRRVENVPVVSQGRRVINNIHPRVSPPGGANTKRKTWPQNSILCRCRSSRPWSPPNFLLIMDFSPDSLPNVSCFDLFVKNPKGCKLEVIQGSHKFLSDVIKGSEQSPKNSVFIGLFNHFTEKKIKDYVFQRMTKSILQELALCILQELISHGSHPPGE